MRKILIADDEKDMRAMVVGVLKGRGFETIEADDGAAALDLAVRHRPDLIISDVMMDCISGFMLRELLRDYIQTAAIPLILMSGRAQGAGAWESDPEVEYLPKPFTASELLAAVDRKLNPKSRD